MAPPRNAPVSAQLELPFAPVSMNPVVTTSTLLDGQAVNYILHRSPGRRRISLSVDERGLRVGAPLRASLREIETLLRDHARWVIRKLSEWNDKRVPVRRWATGETLAYLGLPLKLEVAQGERGVALMPPQLQIRAPDPAAASVEALTTHWLRTQALDHFHQRIAHFRPRVTLDATGVTLRLSNARGRWGSCHVSGRISLSWRLIHFPQHLIDYVVVHELAHLREMNHSPRFWAVVGSVIPDYAARRREIRREAHRYLLD
jgi:predicted metal-dependent hydrolase